MEIGVDLSSRRTHLWWVCAREDCLWIKR